MITHASLKNTVQNRTPRYKQFQFFLLTVSAAVLFFRSPELFYEPRFWAEEATLYFRYAWLENWWKTLIFVPWAQGGYISLSANVPALLASRLVPLEYAPAITTAIAALVLLLPAYLIIFGRSLLWKSPLQKTLALAVYLFSPIHAEESWLNSINSMSYLGVVSLIILLEDTSKHSRSMLLFQAVTLFYNGLSAVYTVFLAPAFILKAYLFRGNTSLFHPGMVIVAALIQIAIVILLALSDGLPRNKFENEPRFVKSTAAAFQYHVIEAFVAHRNSYAVSEAAGISWNKNVLEAPESQKIIVLFKIIVFFMILTSIFLCGTTLKTALLILVAFLFESAFSAYGAMNGIAGGRYAIVPQFAFLLMPLASVCAGFKNAPLLLRTLRSIALVSLLVAIYYGAQIHSNRKWNSYTPEAPRWKHEVRQWRDNPSYKLKVWPYPAWQFQLPTQSGMDSLRSFAERINKEIKSGTLSLKDTSTLLIRSDISEIPLKAKFKLHLNPLYCQQLSIVTLTFTGLQKPLRYSTRLNEKKDCSTINIIVTGPFNPGHLLTGTLVLQATADTPLNHQVLQRVEVLPDKKSLF